MNEWAVFGCYKHFVSPVGSGKQIAHTSYQYSLHVFFIFPDYLLWSQSPRCRPPPLGQSPEPTVSSSSTRPKPAAPTPILPGPAASTHLQPKPAAPTYGPPPVLAAPILLVLPPQPQAPSVLFRGPSCSQSFVRPAPTVKAFMPNKPSRPCGACHVPNCSGQRKRYTP